MTASATDIILHNYPQSPVAEKVRKVLGIKGLTWHDVEIPRLPPKPLLTPLTGGYRRTPVMQIGSDIFCDSQCIIRELERRHPSPIERSDANAGLMWVTSRFTDGDLFSLAVKIVLGAAADALDEDFAKDRGLLYFGEDWAESLKQANAELPHFVSQLRAPFSWIDDTLSDGRKFLLGPQAAAIDAQIYYMVWFIRGRWSGGPSLLSEFKDLLRWEQNMLEIGHGNSTSLDAIEALSVALNSEPVSESDVADNDPQGLKAGMSVSIAPDMESGEQLVEGTIRSANAESIAIDLSTEEAGNVCVHFPRTGYRVFV